jgi:small subunit ribosomal protein S3
VNGKSRWFAGDPKKYREYIRTDAAVRKYLSKKLRGMYIAGVEIERNEKTFRIIISTARPGLIIGRSGEGATKLRKEIDMLLPHAQSLPRSQKSRSTSKKFVHQK